MGQDMRTLKGLPQINHNYRLWTVNFFKYCSVPITLQKDKH